MKERILIVSVVCLLSAISSYSSELPRSTPEEQGISSEGIFEFVEAAEEKVNEIHSFMMLRHGKVVAEGWWTPFNPDSPHMLFSLSKSFTSTAIGLAIEEGRLSLDDRVLDFLPEYAPENPSANLRAMRIRDLLSMSTGHHTEDLQQFSFQAEGPLAKRFLELPVAHKPGTHFLYNTPATYMSSAILQRVAERPVLDYLRPRLFDPLGITDPFWQSDAEGINLGGFGLNVRTEDIAKFGQLYLQHGKWEGKQLVPAEWVEQATARQTSNGSNPNSDWEQGYGYQFWRTRHGFFRGDGAHGQFCIVMPQHDAVIAITSGTGDMGRVMNLVWDILLPAIHEEVLPADTDAQEELAKKLSSLTLAQPQGKYTASLTLNVSGLTYDFPENDQNIESVRFEFGENQTTLFIRNNGTDYELPVGHGSWLATRNALAAGIGIRVPDPAEQGIAASGAWVASDTFVVKFAFYETPFTMTTRFRFDGNQLFIDSEHNVGSNPPQEPQIIGIAR